MRTVLNKCVCGQGQIIFTKCLRSPLVFLPKRRRCSHGWVSRSSPSGEVKTKLMVSPGYNGPLQIQRTPSPPLDGIIYSCFQPNLLQSLEETTGILAWLCGILLGKISALLINRFLVICSGKHSRRIETEENAKVVTAGWGTYCILECDTSHLAARMLWTKFFGRTG